MPKKILVTGGAGFIGSCIARSLLANGYEVDVIDDLSTGFKENIPQGASFHEMDISKPRSLQEIEFAKYDAVFHLAAQSSGEKSFQDPTKDMVTNSFSTAMLLEKSLKNGVRRFLYASSMGVYGNSRNQPVAESEACVPISFYGSNKFESENYCRIYQGLGLDTTCFRMFNVYGPGQNMQNMFQGMLSIYLTFLLNGQKIKIKGSLDRYRDFIYIDDVVDAWMRGYEGDKAIGKIYNLGSGVKTTVLDLIKMLVKACKGRDLIPDDYEILDKTPGDQFGMYANIEKIKKDLDWYSKFSLEEGIATMVKWAQCHVSAKAPS